MQDYVPGHIFKTVHNFDRLSHFRYRELKITSEPESEVPLSDDNDGSSKPRGTEDVNKESVEQSLKSFSSMTNASKKSVISNDIVLEKLIILILLYLLFLLQF